MEVSEKAQKGEAVPEMKLKPVGVVRSNLKELSLVAESGDLAWQANAPRTSEVRSGISELVIDSRLAAILDGIEDFSHILVLYWAHCGSHERRSLTKVHPAGRRHLPFVGVFATRSPARPNPICVTTVRLLERKANVLRVEGLDAVNGSPVIDIKPYCPTYDAVGEMKLATWMLQLQRELAEGSLHHGESEQT